MGQIPLPLSLLSERGQRSDAAAEQPPGVWRGSVRTLQALRTLQAKAKLKHVSFKHSLSDHSGALLLLTFKD